MGQVDVLREQVVRSAPESSIWLRWLAWSSAGELAGFLVPAVAGVLLASAPARVAVPALVVAGEIEGAVLGWAQGRALSPVVPRLRLRRFVVATSAAAAALAYAFAMAAMALAEQEGAPSPVLLVLAALAGGLVLLSIGTGQWFELRHTLPHGRSWIVTTALSGAVALGVFSAIAMPLWHEGQQLIVAIAIGAGAGLCMAATTAALTGLAMIRLLRRASVLPRVFPPREGIT